MKTSITPLLTSAFVILRCRFFSRIILSGCLAALGSSLVIAQGGPLTPPGAPAPTMRSLQEIFTQDTTTQTNVGTVQTSVNTLQTSVNNLQDDPRTPISSLPFTISTSGSYYLTGNLTAASAGAGITVAASHVTLDLGGFVLAGNGGTAQHGVRVNTSITNVTIRNGTVRAWTGDGISMAVASSCTDLRVENVRAISNAGAGIRLGDEGAATGCTARGNSASGIVGGLGCQVLACTAANNTGATSAGIFVAERALVRDCVATENGADGINVGTDSVVTHCTTKLNGDDGIETGISSMVRSCTAANNTDVGIEAAPGSSVSDCTADSNAGASAISVGAGASVFRCVARSNTSSAATSQSILAGSLSSVIECNVAGTFTTAGTFTASTGMGIVVGDSCVVERNIVNNCRGDGIRAGAICRIIGNLVSDSGNSAGNDGAGIHTTNFGNHIDGNTISNGPRGIDVDSNSSTIVRNRVRNCTANYAIAASNNLGAIVVPGNNAAINGNGAVASSLGTTDPWANLSN